MEGQGNDGRGALRVRGVAIGEGLPKICVPLIGGTLELLREEAASVAPLKPDLVEWRVDHYEQCGSVDDTLAALEAVRSALPGPPLLFTFRSRREGGQREVPAAHYAALNLAAAGSGMAELVDVELMGGDAETVREWIAGIRSKGAATIVSNHDFAATPETEELVRRLELALELGGDIPKIAVMPRSPRDVLRLLEATAAMKERHPGRPVITMSMGGLGAVSRMAGEVFGSAVTFGSASTASAPGQIPVKELRDTLELLHRGM